MKVEISSQTIHQFQFKKFQPQQQINHQQQQMCHQQAVSPEVNYQQMFYKSKIF
jgi:hypothetical protein